MFAQMPKEQVQVLIAENIFSFKEPAQLAFFSVLFISRKMFPAHKGPAGILNPPLCLMRHEFIQPIIVGYDPTDDEFGQTDFFGG